MNDAEVIDSIMVKLSKRGGRHLYGVLGSYRALERFSGKLQEAKTLDGKPFPKPLSVNRGILETIPDEEFRKLVQDERQRGHGRNQLQIMSNGLANLFFAPFSRRMGL